MKVTVAIKYMRGKQMEITSYVPLFSQRNNYLPQIFPTPTLSKKAVNTYVIIVISISVHNQNSNNCIIIDHYINYSS